MLDTHAACVLAESIRREERTTAGLGIRDQPELLFHLSTAKTFRPAEYPLLVIASCQCPCGKRHHNLTEYSGRLTACTLQKRTRQRHLGIPSCKLASPTRCSFSRRVSSAGRAIPPLGLAYVTNPNYPYLFQLQVRFDLQSILQLSSPGSSVLYGNLLHNLIGFSRHRTPCTMQKRTMPVTPRDWQP